MNVSISGDVLRAGQRKFNKLCQALVSRYLLVWADTNPLDLGRLLHLRASLRTMTLPLFQVLFRWTAPFPLSASLAWVRGESSVAIALKPSQTWLGRAVSFRWQRSLLLVTSFWLTLGVVLLEVSSAAIFLGRMSLGTLALVYGGTAVLGFGLRGLSQVLSWHLSRRFGVRGIRLVTALAWVALVGLWLGLCFGEPWGYPWGDALPMVALGAKAISAGAVGARPVGAELPGQTALQVLMLQCGAMLLAQFHRAQVQGAQISTGVGGSPFWKGAIASSRPISQEPRSTSARGTLQPAMPLSPGLSLAVLPWAWFTFGAYALVGLLLPWCLGASGPALPLESIALGSSLLILLGAIPRLILAAPLGSVAGRPPGANFPHNYVGDDAEDDTDDLPTLLRHYGRWLLIFFALSQLLTLVIQWGLWGQLQLSLAGDWGGTFPGATAQAVEIAVFLAWIQGAVGFVGLLLQSAIAQGWLVRHGVFTALAWSPLVMLALSLLVVQDRLPLLWGLALLRGLDEGLQYSLGQYAQGRLWAQLPRMAFVRLRQQRIVTESLAMGFLGIALLLGWHILGETLPKFLFLILAGLIWATLVVLALVRYRYFQLILGAIEQQAMRRCFPQGPVEQLGAQRLLSQPESSLVKRGLVKSLRRSLGEPVQLEEAITSIRLLDRLDPWLAVEALAPALMRLPPMLQLEGLAIMTRLGRQAQAQISAQIPGQIPGQTSVSGQGSVPAHLFPRRPFHKRYNPQQHLRSVDALMTPIAPPAVFAAALRHSLYLGPAISPKALQLHLQPERSPLIRAVAAAFALNPWFGSDWASHSSWRAGPKANNTMSHRLTQAQWSELVPQAQEILRAMLTHEAQEERRAASEVLGDLADLTPFKAQIPALLQDFSPQVRKAVIAAIAETRSQVLYPYLLKGLRSPLVEQSAHRALVQLGHEAVPLLQRCTQHPDLSLKTKEHSWQILTEIGSQKARATLAEDVLHQQGEARARLLTLLLNQPQGAVALSQALAGSEGVMQLVREELWLLSQLYAALADLHPKALPGLAARQLRQALNCQKRDVGERILLLLQIRYPAGGLNLVVEQLRHRSTIPQGLKRLAQLLEPPFREPLLAVFDARSVEEKRRAFANWEAGDDSTSLPGNRCKPAERLRQLVVLEPGLDARGLACVYDLALEQEIALRDEELLRGINHGDSEVCAAAQAYLNRMPEAVVMELLAIQSPH